MEPTITIKPECCGDCRFSKMAMRGFNLICRRFPPVEEDTRDSKARFPRVEVDDWCGEFKWR